MIRYVILAALGLGLSACGDNAETPPPGDEEASARGEVLGGSISDDMLPLDTITSQAPSLAEEGSSDDDSSDPATPAAPASQPDPEPEPQSEPEPEPAPAESGE